MIIIDVPFWQIVQLFGSTVLPLLVGLVTTRVTAPGRRATLLAALAVLTSLATELGSALQSGASYNLGTALVFGLLSFVVAVASHYGILKPKGWDVAAQNTLVTVDAREIRDAEQDKALEVFRKAGVATATEPANPWAFLPAQDGPAHRRDV